MGGGVEDSSDVYSDETFCFPVQYFSDRVMSELFAFSVTAVFLA